MTSARLTDDADNATRTPRRARRACGFCTRRKIRCNKELPSCSACKLNKRQCSYRKITVQFDEGDEANGKLLIARNELSSLCSHAEKTRAAIAFLDHGLSLRGPALSPLTFDALSHMPAYIKALVGDHAECQRISAQYYKMIHPWLPIVSKKKVYDHILNPLAQPRVDTAFLLLCMKIVASSEERVNPCTAEYQAAVQLGADVQFAGIISAEVLQGCILLAVYEQGHAMYPAAHVRVGACFKYAVALSMGWETSRNSCPKGGAWAEEEEEVRTWWAIYLLERVGAIGRPGQLLAIPEPDMTAQLPCTDQDWNDQVSSQTPSTLSSPPETLGRYASVVQSGYLLSRVFRHATDTSASSEFQRLEVEQLDRTLYALIRYSESNEGTLYQIKCYQTAISFCALILLYAPYMEHQAGPLYESAKSVLDTAAIVSLQVTREYSSTDELNITNGDIPPFVVPWLYKMAAWFLQDGQKDNFEIIESALRKLDRRWKSAGTCLELLAARRVMASVPI